MLYYLVWVKSERYRGYEPLTYQSPEKLAVGQIVQVPLRNRPVLGFVVAPTTHPAFPTKPITQALALPPLPGASLELASWLLQHYPSPIGVISPVILPVEFGKLDLQPLKAKDPRLHDLSPFTKQQQTALETIDHPDTCLLHGRTGSGKTRIYLELAVKALANRQSALILTPEIGLS